MKKKICFLGVLLLCLAMTAFAQNKDSEVVLQQDGTEITAPLVYHLEVWDQNGATTDSGQFLTPVNNLRKYGSVCFLIHADNGYIVVMYASPDWAPALQKPQGVLSKYILSGDSKQIIREALNSRVFKQYITRERFITDLETTYAGLK